MKLTVALDARYALTPDNRAWSQVGMAYEFWERYLEVFESVTIVARAKRVSHPPEGWGQVTGDGVSITGIPDYLGPSQYLLRYTAIRSAIRRATPSVGAVILRVGSQVANMMQRELAREKRPYALEVIGDPYAAFAPGALDHPLRAFFRWHFSRTLQRQCRDATGVAYVTERALQERYPTRAVGVGISDVDLPDEALLHSGFSTHYSNVELEQSHLADATRLFKGEGTVRIITVGSLAQLYKGTDVLIDAIAICLRRGLDITVTIVGDGKYRGALIAQAERLGISDRVDFPGQITAGEPVRNLLDAADLFILPSRSEGLPRALIEAMARGLPCVGTSVGGVPELLGADELVPAGDPGALAAKIQELL